MIDPVQSVKEAIQSSTFLAALRRLNEPISADLRSLTQAEIAQLERQGNLTTGDWSHIRVAKNFTPRRIWQNTFFGNIEIGAQFAEFEVGGIKRKAGIYNSVIYDAKIEDNVFIKSVDGISNYRICTGAAVAVCGSLQVSLPCTFFNGTELDSIGVETGGRGLKVFAEITLETAARLMRSRKDKALLTEYASCVEKYTEAARSGWGVIGKGARVLNTNKVHNVYLGEFGEINNAVLVEDATILSSEDEKTRVSDGAYVKGGILQWGSEIVSMGILTDSVMLEHSHVANHGKVHQSIIGANSGVAKGEITSSLVGPFVGFHHQSLLISAYWPEGKGNIAYGANVGSNHTSRAPDQEIWPGEGLFFGLATSIKFPANYAKAPYTIIATNVIALPQRVEFPFSLINLPSATFPEVSPAYNEIFPAWVLSDNIFLVKRNEGKYKKRNKARRAQIEFKIFRREIVETMTAARDQLAGVREIKAVYTDRDLPSLGKNYMVEKTRKKAIEAYDFYIRYYLLREMYGALSADPAAGEALLGRQSNDREWEYARKMFQIVLKGVSVKAALLELKKVQTVVANGVLECKKKDDRRGVRIIDDYREAHLPAEEESFVKETFVETEALHRAIDQMITRL